MEKDLEYLKTRNASGVSSYEQIGNFLLKLFLERPPQKRVYHEFEAEVRELAAPPEASKAVRPVTGSEKDLARLAYSFYKKFARPRAEGEGAEAEDTDEGQEQDAGDYPDIPDLVALSSRLRSVGMPFSPNDAAALQEALRRLAAQDDRAGDRITLFGKVGCYWVLRAETENYPEPEEAEEAEEATDEAGAGAEAEEEPESEPEPEEEPEEEPEPGEAAGGEDGQDRAHPAADPEAEAHAEEEEEEEPEAAAEAAAEAADEPILSTVSLDEEYAPPTRAPKRVPVYRGAVFPRRRLPAIPREEHEGVNRDLYFAAVDVAMSEFARSVFLQLADEARLAEYRRAHRLRQRRTGVSAVLRGLLARPLAFVPLPEVSPEMMRAVCALPSAAIRFTGDLTRPLGLQLPLLDGVEAHLLRGVVTRIRHECAIVPKALYVREPEEPDEDAGLLTDRERQERAIARAREHRLSERTRFMRVYEILLRYPALDARGADDEPESNDALFAEVNEDTPGYADLRALLRPEEWALLLPRITGQGRVQPLTADEYDGLDDPEPCEVRVARELKRRRQQARAARRAERLAAREAAREAERAALRARLGERRYRLHLAKLEEQGEPAEDPDEAPASEDSDPDDLNIPEDDYDDAEPLERPELPEALDAAGAGGAGDTDNGQELSPEQIQEWNQYYATLLWRRLRVFRRPVCPWDASVVDNKTNVLLPDLFQPSQFTDRTRVDFKNPKKCRYEQDEPEFSNRVAMCKTTVPIWRLQTHTDPVNRETLVTATNVRWPGSLVLVHGRKGTHCTQVYFGDGICADAQDNGIALPDMCVPTVDCLEEGELPVERQREMYAAEQEKRRLRAEKAEAERRAAEEAEGAEEAEEA